MTTSGLPPMSVAPVAVSVTGIVFAVDAGVPAAVCTVIVRASCLMRCRWGTSSVPESAVKSVPAVAVPPPSA